MAGSSNYDVEKDDPVIISGRSSADEDGGQLAYRWNLSKNTAGSNGKLSDLASEITTFKC